MAENDVRLVGLDAGRELACLTDSLGVESTIDSLVVELRDGLAEGQLLGCPE